ncbi:hypothetical protein KA517_00750 [Candidatus Gracilibacteria bacterium]|jgi:F0F1-type ATP synthase assembly protein I|nr:hypothetical protein [Candidatus Gracilibacteria bacterium]
MLSSFATFHVRRFVIVVGLTLLFATVFALVGRALDEMLQTGPLFLVVMLVVAFVLLQIVLLKITRALVKQHQDKMIK